MSRYSLVRRPLPQREMEERASAFSPPLGGDFGAAHFAQAKSLILLDTGALWRRRFKITLAQHLAQRYQ